MTSLVLTTMGGGGLAGGVAFERDFVSWEMEMQGGPVLLFDPARLERRSQRRGAFRPW